MHLRRGNKVKKNVPENNIATGIKNGKLIATDEVSVDGKTWASLNKHPSFSVFFKSTPRRLVKKPAKSIPDESGTIAEIPKRILAFIADCIVVYFLHKTVAWILFQSGIYYQYGSNIILIFIAILYFSLLECRLTNGKTLGKYLLSLSNSLAS